MSDKELEPHLKEVGMCLQLSQVCKGGHWLDKKACPTMKDLLLNALFHYPPQNSTFCRTKVGLWWSSSRVHLSAPSLLPCMSGKHLLLCEWPIKPLTINILVFHISPCKRRDAEALNLLWIPTPFDKRHLTRVSFNKWDDRWEDFSWG